MHLTGIMLIFWVAGFAAHAALLFVLLYRHRAATFPAFTAFVAMNFISSPALYEVATHGSKYAYFVSYFVFVGVDLILQLAVTFELARYVFRPTGKWAPDVRNSFVIVAVISIMVAAALACIPSPPEKRLIGALLDRGDLFSSALQCQLFVGMIALSATAGLAWKTHVARIAQGLGFYSLIGILAAAGHDILVRNSALFNSVTYFRMVAYLSCATYWIVTLWMDAPAPRELPEVTRRQLFTLQRRVEYDLRKLRAAKR